MIDACLLINDSSEVAFLIGEEKGEEALLTGDRYFGIVLLILALTHCSLGKLQCFCSRKY